MELLGRCIGPGQGRDHGRSPPALLIRLVDQHLILALPPAQRAALALFYFEDLSVGEIAIALDVPAGTIKTRLMHARRALRAVLEGEDHV